jgi:hypothetical protein
MALSASEVTTTTIIDSGCSQHMTNIDYRTYDLKRSVKSIPITDGGSIHSTHVGNMVCTQADLSSGLILNRVRQVLLLKNMLLSAPAITYSGIEVTFTKDSVEFKQGVESLAKGKRKGSIYKLALDIEGTANL